MGTDNLFHKRKSKNTAGLKRRPVRREPYAKILIVCEGEKTEPQYFNGVRNHYALNSANIEVCGDCSSDPMSIVKYSKQRYREEKDAGDAFDKVFCVFDKDTHPGYGQALATISSSAPQGTFVAINSVPCFEYWLLLHFVYSTKPYLGLPTSSAGDQLLSELKTYMPDYEKNADNVFARLISQLDFALQNAIRSLRDAEASGTDNPTTRVHELVTFMRNIKSGGFDP